MLIRKVSDFLHTTFHTQTVISNLRKTVTKGRNEVLIEKLNNEKNNYNPSRNFNNKLFKGI